MLMESPSTTAAAIKATFVLFIGYSIIRFAVAFYKARSRMLELRAQGLPMPPYSAILGHLPFAYKITSGLPKDAHPNYLLDMIRRQCPDLGPIFYLDTWPFGPQMLAVSSLEGLRQITQEHSLPKYHALKKFLEPIADGQDIVTMEGQEWKRWRSIFNPGFSMSNLLTMATDIVDETAVFCERLASLAQNQKVFEMKSLTDFLTLDIITNIVLNTKLRSQTAKNPLAEGLRSQIKWLMFGGDVNPLERFNPVRPIVLWYNKRRMNNFIRPHLNGQLSSTVFDATRKTTIVDLAAKAYLADKGGKLQKVDPAFERLALNQVKLFLFSGHDTTSSSVCYLFYILELHPQIAERVRNEHDDVFGSSIDDAAVAIKKDSSILNRLPYTTAVIKESLRLYPTVSSTRAGEQGFKVVDSRGRKYPTEGFLVWANPQTVHRDPAYWPDPDKLIPERWLVPADDPLHPPKGAWRPFEHGPRNCIGQELAMMEMKIILVMVARKYTVTSVYDELDSKSSNNRLRHVYGERGYQIQRAQPSGDLPCRVHLRIKNDKS